MHDEFFKI